MHRRVSTCVMDPSLPNHCAYQCVLKAAGTSPTMKAVQSLRNKTADKVYQAYINDEQIAALDVRAVVQASDMTLQAYLAAVRHTQWASAVEIAFAAQIVNISIAIKTKDTEVVLGNVPKYAIKLKNNHWRLYTSRVSRSPVSQMQYPVCRGGMPSGTSESPPTPSPSQVWTWEYPEGEARTTLQQTPPVPATEVETRQPAPQDVPHDEDEEIPAWAKTPSQSTIGKPVMSKVPDLFLQPGEFVVDQTKLQQSRMSTPSAPNLHAEASQQGAKNHADRQNVSVPTPTPTPMKTIRVRVDPAVRTDIDSLQLTVQCAMTVGGCIDRLVQILSIDRRRTSLCHPSTKAAFSIWNPVPDDVLVVDDWAVLETIYHMVNVHVSNTNYSFIVPAEKTWTHQHFKQYICAIMGGQATTMLITDMAGKPWTYPESYPKHSNIRVYSGVLRGGMRTVSTTADYVEEDPPSEQPEDVQPHVQNPEQVAEVQDDVDIARHIGMAS